MPEQRVIGLMQYIDDLKSQQVRDIDSHSIIKNTLRTLDVLNTTTSLIYNQIVPLEKEIWGQIDDDEFKNNVDMVFHGISIKIGNYFSHQSNLLTCNTEETRVLADCIASLLKRINELKADNEAKVLERQEMGLGQKQEEKKEEVAEFEDKELIELSKMQSEQNEEEEEELSIAKNIYQCSECRNVFEKASEAGCKKCGNNTFQLMYAQRSS